mgnify:FL=1
MTEEQIVDVVAEEVTEQPTPTVFEHETEVSEPVAEEQMVVPPQESYADLWVKHKKREYKRKQIEKQIRDNNKAQRGFGYTYKPLNINDFNGFTYDPSDFTPLGQVGESTDM